MNIEITNIILDDLESIYKLGTGIDDFSADGGENIFWPKETLTRLFQSEDDVCMALRVNREIVGFSLDGAHRSKKKQPPPRATRAALAPRQCPASVWQTRSDQAWQP